MLTNIYKEVEEMKHTNGDCWKSIYSLLLLIFAFISIVYDDDTDTAGPFLTG